MGEFVGRAHYWNNGVHVIPFHCGMCLLKLLELLIIILEYRREQLRENPDWEQEKVVIRLLLIKVLL